jgi:GTPase SAR1 family protein
MRSIILVVGLPGSGKTFFAHEYYSDALIVDDPMRQGVVLPPPDVDFDTMVITDPHLCRDHNLQFAMPMLMRKYRVTQLGVAFFENDPVKAKANVKLRNDGRKVDRFIDTLTKEYNPPPNAMPIWTMN